MQLFVSHSWDDKAVVYDLVADVEALLPGLDVWLDGDLARSAGDARDRSDRALSESDLVVLVWSPSAARSAGVAHEVVHAARSGIRVLPCLVTGPCSPPPLPSALGQVTEVLRIGPGDIRPAAATIAGRLPRSAASEGDAVSGGGQRWRRLLRPGRCVVAADLQPPGRI